MKVYVYLDAQSANTKGKNTCDSLDFLLEDLKKYVQRKNSLIFGNYIIIKGYPFREIQSNGFQENMDIHLRDLFIFYTWILCYG